MSLPDCAFMTFYFNDGTKETVEAYTYSMGLSKLQKEDPLNFHPFWQMGKGEGQDSMTWVKEKGWILSKEANKQDVVFPWYDCMVSFDIVKSIEEVRKHLPKYELPNGWSLSETSGDYIATFLIEGIPLLIEDGEIVKKILHTIDTEEV